MDPRNGFPNSFFKEELIDVSALVERGAKKPAVTPENIELLGSLGELATSSFLELARNRAQAAAEKPAAKTIAPSTAGKAAAGLAAGHSGAAPAKEHAAPAQVTARPEYRAALGDRALIEALLKHPIAQATQRPAAHQSAVAPAPHPGAPASGGFSLESIEQVDVEMKRSPISRARPSHASPILRTKR